MFVAGARGIGMHMVSVLLSKMVRPNVPKTSMKNVIIRPSPRGDRDTMHASSAYSIPQIARRTFQCRFRANFRRLFLQLDEIREYACVLSESL